MGNKAATIPAAAAKTVCLTARRQPDPSVIGAMYDADDPERMRKKISSFLTQKR